MLAATHFNRIVFGCNSYPRWVAVLNRLPLSAFFISAVVYLCSGVVIALSLGLLACSVAGESARFLFGRLTETQLKARFNTHWRTFARRLNVPLDLNHQPF